MEILKSEEIIAESLQQIEKVFRGSLIIRANDVLRWKLYFRLGRLSWVTGGINFRERLQRHLAITCPQISPYLLRRLPVEYKPSQEQKILVHLQGQGTISREQMATLMERIAIEVIFDAIQYGETNSENISCYKVVEEQNENLLLLLPFLDINVVLAKARQKWDRWKTSGLAAYSPNSYPIVKDSAILAQSIERDAERQIINSLNGKKTLRQLAVKHQKSLIDIALFLAFLVDSGAIALDEFKNNNQVTSSNTKTTKNGFVSFPPLPPPIQTRRKKVSQSPSKENNSVSQEISFLANENISSIINSNLNYQNSHNFTSNKSASTSQKKPSLIICIDDSPLVCQAVKNIVVEQKHRFLAIQQPVKVIPTLLRNKPDLIFLDLMMPVINGYELCAQMRKTPSLKDIPIIILTGKDGLIDRMRAKLVGSTNFVAKPVKTFPVLKMLDKYLIANQSEINHE